LNGNSVVRRVTASFAGVLFLIVAGLLVVGFGGLGTYPLWLRLVLAGVVVVYGLIRLRGAFVRPPEGD
jgi:hypothetical protein